MKRKNYIAPDMTAIDMYAEDVLLTCSREPLPGDGEDDVVFEGPHKGGWNSEDWSSAGNN